MAYCMTSFFLALDYVEIRLMVVREASFTGGAEGVTGNCRETLRQKDLNRTGLWRDR